MQTGFLRGRACVTKGVPMSKEQRGAGTWLLRRTTALTPLWWKYRW